MKKSTYDALSTIAVIVLVFFTFLAQHSSKGYLFGVIAVLAAAGSFAMYVKALATADSTAKQSSQPGIQQEAEAGDLVRTTHERYADSLRRRRQLLLSESAGLREHSWADLKLMNYNRLVAAQVRI